MFDLILFDLDGTLLDSREDIAAAVNHALASAGRPPLPLETVGRYVGDGLRQLLERAFATGDEAVLAPAIRAFREHYSRHFLDRTRPYPGVREALNGLRGKILGIVTNKPADFARQMLAALKLDGSFRVVVGEGDTPERKPLPGPFRRALELAAVPADRALMVGDGPQDLLGGRAAGIRTCAVTFGFTARAELEKLEPDYVIDDLRELIRLTGGR